MEKQALSNIISKSVYPHCLCGGRIGLHCSKFKMLTPFDPTSPLLDPKGIMEHAHKDVCIVIALNVLCIHQ